MILLMKEKGKTNNSNIKRIHIVFVATTIFVMIVFVASAFFYRFYLEGLTKSQSSTKYSQYYVMIPDDRKSSFSQSVYMGAYDYAQENDIYVDMFGEYFTTDYSKEELLRMAIASNVDGIILEADESEKITELIDEAYAEKIPVVTLMNDNTKSQRVCFVGVGGYNVGKEYGQQVLQIIKTERQKAALESESSEKTSDVNVSILINSVTENSGQNIIISGIQDSISQGNTAGANVNITVVPVDNTNTFSVEESIRDLFMNQNIPDVIICLDELTTTCVYQAVVDYNVVGEVSVLGYFDSDAIVNAIDRGTIYSTVAIDTKGLGEYCVEALMDYNEFGTTSQYYTADINLITESNVSMYLKKEEDADDK